MRYPKNGYRYLAISEVGSTAPADSFLSKPLGRKIDNPLPVVQNSIEEKLIIALLDQF